MLLWYNIFFSHLIYPCINYKHYWTRIARDTHSQYYYTAGWLKQVALCSPWIVEIVCNTQCFVSIWCALLWEWLQITSSQDVWLSWSLMEQQPTPFLSHFHLFNLFVQPYNFHTFRSCLFSGVEYVFFLSIKLLQNLLNSKRIIMVFLRDMSTTFFL